MSQILSDLIEFSKPRKTNLHGHVEIQSLTQEVLENIKEITPQKTQFDFETDGEQIHANIDPFKMEQVLKNILKNAAEAANENKNPIVKVSLKKSLHEISLKIEDNGPGIQLEDKSRIFEPFFTTKRPGKGTGLGLSVTHGIVAGLGGQINTEKSSLGGASFLITIPTGSDKAKDEFYEQ